MTKTLLVEGWRKTSHSYALVNQNQLVHLAGDGRFRLHHVDVPLFRQEWAGIGDGLDKSTRSVIDALGPPGPGVVPDVVYRISFPLRIHPSPPTRVVVFGTTEFGLPPQGALVGPPDANGTAGRAGVEIVTPSTWSKAGFVNAGFRPESVHVVPHGIDPGELQRPDDAQRAALRAQMGVPADAFVFLNIGATTWNKGIGLLLAAFGIHRRRYPRSLLLLKGADAMYGNRLADARAEAEALRPGAFDEAAAAAISYIGSNLNRKGLASLYFASDAYVTPYRGEGFSMPTLEALGAGTPVIVTRGGSTDDFCPDAFSLKIDARTASLGEGRYGLEPEIDSIVDCMQKVVEDGAFRARVAEQAGSWAAERYSWALVTRRLGDILAG
jgi:glycosyltransferase involved in cell wall biosynthesis